MPDINSRRKVILSLDLFQPGVAGLNSWGALPLDQYRFMGKDYRYGYTFRFIK